MTFYQYRFRQCKHEDYIRNGILDNNLNIKDRYCPDINAHNPLYKVKNSYINNKNQNSFGITIEKC